MPSNYNTCPTCGAPTLKAYNVFGTPSEGWRECTRCNSLINTYQPQPHQLAVHQDDHRYIGNFGAYGTGKTMTSRQQVYRHVLVTPNANVLIGAKVTSQYEQTIKRELLQDLPALLIANYNKQKDYIDLVNGARIMFRPFDDPDKMRSMNLTMFVIIEASETPAEAYHQLKTRLRNLAATNHYTDEDGNIVVTDDWRQGIIESNPDAGWIRTDFLNVTRNDNIHSYGEHHDEYHNVESHTDPLLSCHIASTSVNRFLPPTFVQELTANKPTWWVNRYIFGSFSYSEGLVYPTALRQVVPAFEIPKDWPRLVACDYGLSDKFTYVAVAIDTVAGVAYLYKNWATTDRNIEQLSKMYQDFTADIPTGGMYCAPLLDPKSGAKRDYNKKTLFDHFLDYNIVFKPGHIAVDARLYRLNTYLESDKLRIFDTCTEIIDELRDYKFPDKTLNKVQRTSADKPQDKNNHSINALEWITMELPADPKKLYLSSYDQNFNNLYDMMQSQAPTVWQLNDSTPQAVPDMNVFNFSMYDM